MFRGHLTRILSLPALLIVFAAVITVFLIRHPVKVSKETEWAIGIYQGDAELRFRPADGIKNPVLQYSDVNDVKADFVADPFLVKSGTLWYMFFEVMNSLTRQGDIGCAKSPDGLHWQYQKIVLDEPFHLSYPYVFQWEGNFYMIPESAEAKAIRLYRAKDFPLSWSLESDLIPGQYADTCVFYFHETWWMLTCSKPYTHEELRLFYADKPTGPWTQHPQSPIITNDPSKARCGGRILVNSDSIVRFAQNDYRTYGRQVRAFTITELTKTRYSEQEFRNNPVLTAQGNGWNAHGMHTIDACEIFPGEFLAAVDGYRKQLVFKIQY